MYNYKFIPHIGLGEKDNICGKCKYHRKDWTNPKNESWYCWNERSDYSGYNTEYTDTCSEWEGRD